MGKPSASEETITVPRHAFDDMVRLMTRRFDELSAEIDASTQLLGMAEDGIARRFAEVLSVLGAISYQGSGATPHNVGVELSAVVKTTEDAADRILSAAESISALIEQSRARRQEGAARATLDAIAAHTQEILAACAFQDLTGQRIGKTLQNIRHAEAELAETLKRLGLKIDPQPEMQSLCGTQAMQTQDEIDSLFTQ